MPCPTTRVRTLGFHSLVAGGALLALTMLIQTVIGYHYVTGNLLLQEGRREGERIARQIEEAVRASEQRDAAQLGSAVDDVYRAMPGQAAVDRGHRRSEPGARVARPGSRHDLGGGAASGARFESAVCPAHRERRRPGDRERAPLPLLGRWPTTERAGRRVACDAGAGTRARAIARTDDGGGRAVSREAVCAIRPRTTPGRRQRADRVRAPGLDDRARRAIPRLCPRQADSRRSSMPPGGCSASSCR